MKNRRVFIFVVCLLLVIPILLLVFVTTKEMERYEHRDSFEIREKSYGVGQVVILGRLEETVEITGSFTSKTIKTYKLPLSCVIFLEQGTEVFKGEKLSDCKNSEKLEHNGVIRSLNIEQDAYIIEVIDIDVLVFEGYIVNSQIDLAKGSYQTINDETYTLFNKSNIMNEDGIKLFFNIEGTGNYYGQEQTIMLRTGFVLDEAILVLEDAVYKNAENVDVLRIIDENGNVLSEQQVTKGISNGQFVSVSGIDVGVFYDVEYGKYQNKQNEK